MTGRVVLAEDDAGNRLTVGPVYTGQSLEEIRRHAGEHGWVVTAVLLNYSRADFWHARGRGEGLVRGGDVPSPGTPGSGGSR